MAELPVRVRLLQQGQPPQDAGDQAPIPRGVETQSRGRAAPRGVGLADQLVGDPRPLDGLGGSEERGLVGDGEDDGVGAVREIAGRGLAARVNDLGGKEATGKVVADDDVVAKRRGVGLVTALVNLNAVVG